MTTVTDDTERMRPSAVTAKDIARAGVTRRARDSRLKIWVGSICALVVILPVAFARVLPLPSPDATDLGARRLPPLTDGHLFGTDQLGRDLLARVLYGGQVSLTIGVLAVVVSGLIGLTLGSLAGYLGGWVDTVVSRLLEAQLSLPLLMMLLLVVALFGPSIPVITFVIAIAQWPEIARITRSLVLVEREKPYIAAARVLGLGKFATLFPPRATEHHQSGVAGGPATARPGRPARERAELPRCRPAAAVRDVGPHHLRRPGLHHHLMVAGHPAGPGHRPHGRRGEPARRRSARPDRRIEPAGTPQEIPSEQIWSVTWEIY